MKNKCESNLLLYGIILSALVFSLNIVTAQDDQTPDNKSKDIVEDIKPYEGTIGPGNALYGLKIALENIGESFTFNDREKIEKQIEHAKLRIAEAKAELNKNNMNGANKALEHYREKILSAEDKVTGIAGTDSGLINAQKEITKHEFVLEQLLESHPNNTGLQRAFDNSLKLEEKFELKTDRKLVRVVTKEEVILRDVRRDRIQEIKREEIEVRAKLVGNDTEVEVRVEFVSNSTERNAIAQDILNKLRLSRDEIENLLEIHDVLAEDLIESLKAEAKVERGFSENEADFRFPLLKTTNRTEIVNGTFSKLSALTVEDILNVLEIKFEKRIKIREFENEKIEIKAEIVGNDTEAKIRLEFTSNNTERDALAQEILNKLKLNRDTISNLLDIEAVEREELRERLRVEVKVGEIRESRRGDRHGDGGERRDGGNRDDRSGADRRGRRGGIVAGNFSEIKVDFEFPLLNTADRTGIVDGIFNKLSVLTINDVLDGMTSQGKGIREERNHEQEVGREPEDRGGERESGGGRGRDGGGDGRR